MGHVLGIIGDMRLRSFLVALFLGALSGCSGQSSIRPVEALDAKTGITWAALREPIELEQSAQSAVVTLGKHTSLIYFGPVEWDRSGNIGYGLWINVAPGSGAQVGDIREPGAVSLILDDGPLVLTTIDAPKLGREAYRPVVSWGQVAYFQLSAGTLRRIAGSQRLELDFRAGDGAVLRFTPGRDAHARLSAFVRGRNIIGD